MTRKDYELIASVFGQFDPHCDEPPIVLAHTLAEAFRVVNPRFNIDRFLNAIQSKWDENNA